MHPARKLLLLLFFMSNVRNKEEGLLVNSYGTIVWNWREMENSRYPVPTGPPIPIVKALSLKFLVRSGGALLLKKPGE